jgi:hypothetical protein
MLVHAGRVGTLPGVSARPLYWEHDMKTIRKPAPIQARTEPWAVQFVRFVEHVGHTAPDADAARQTVYLAFGCMAHLGGIAGDAYSTARDSALEYVRAVVWQTRMTSAYNATPWRGDGMLASVAAAHMETVDHCHAARRDLEAALRELRPSLPLT